MGYNEKLILTDCDGVLLDWETHFHNWMKEQGHIRVHDNISYWQESHYPELTMEEARLQVSYFNTSAWMLNLPAYKDALVGVARLRTSGYRFHAITAMGDDEQALEARKINLRRMFGHDTFVEITATSMYDENGKVDVLSQYKDSGLIWLEDKPKNAEIGSALGLDSIIFQHQHNVEFLKTSPIKNVSNWNELCDKLKCD